MNGYTYLALGDSYTIGEQVSLTESFPYQTVQLLRNYGKNLTSDSIDRRQGLQTLPWFLNMAAPEIIAKTGWTTDELLAAVNQNSFLPAYDIVSLLIGVNNQYRGRTVDSFKIEFEQLLKIAVAFAGDDTKKVFVLSIPDWGITPFAAGKDAEKIALEINAYNAACKNIADVHSCHYIDITKSQRRDGIDNSFLAADLLHPSGKEYAKWAKKLFKAIIG